MLSSKGQYWKKEVSRIVSATNSSSSDKRIIAQPSSSCVPRLQYHSLMFAGKGYCYLVEYNVKMSVIQKRKNKCEPRRILMSRKKGNRLKAFIRPQDMLLCPSLSAVCVCNNRTYEDCIASYKCSKKKQKTTNNHQHTKKQETRR